MSKILAVFSIFFGMISIAQGAEESRDEVIFRCSEQDNEEPEWTSISLIHNDEPGLKAQFFKHYPPYSSQGQHTELLVDQQVFLTNDIYGNIAYKNADRTMILTFFKIHSSYYKDDFKLMVRASYQTPNKPETFFASVLFCGYDTEPLVH